MQDFDSVDSPVTLSRIENLRQNPSKITLADLLSKVELPYRQFFCPYMENQPAESFVLRRQIYYLLDRAQGDERAQKMARVLIDRLKAMLDLNSLINRQLWISLKAELDTVSGRGDEQTAEQICRGIRITYPEFDERNFDGGVLILYECELLLSLARCRSNAGEPRRALELLEKVRIGCVNQPLSEIYKEPLLCETEIAIVRCLLDICDYPAALAASERAMSAAKKQTGSSRMPDAVYLRALAIFYATGDRELAASLLSQAYFAFALLKKPALQASVLLDAREIAGVAFETYGLEKADFELPRDFETFGSGSALAADSIGELLRQFRAQAGAKQTEVYRGICSRSFYSRIESGERTSVNIFILEALMQRLGRDIDLYIEYFSSVGEWEQSRLQTRYMREVYIGSADDAQKTLDELHAVGDFSAGPGKQFLLTAKAMMKAARGDLDGFADIVLEALKITIPDFSEQTIAHTRMTFNECNLANALGYYYIEKGDRERGIAIYTRIRESMNRFYVDDSIKAKYYLTLLSNLAIEHFNLGNCEQALEYANEHEGMSARYGVLHLMNEIALTKAACLNGLGRDSEAGAYAAMAFFSGALTASEHNLAKAEKLAKVDLGMKLEPVPGYIFHLDKEGTYSR